MLRLSSCPPTIPRYPHGSRFHARSAPHSKSFRYPSVLSATLSPMLSSMLSCRCYQNSSSCFLSTIIAILLSSNLQRVHNVSNTSPASFLLSRFALLIPNDSQYCSLACVLTLHAIHVPLHAFTHSLSRLYVLFFLHTLSRFSRAQRITTLYINEPAMYLNLYLYHSLYVYVHTANSTRQCFLATFPALALPI